jgi:protocatechuate 3,4-dioxygenase beta subunit
MPPRAIVAGAAAAALFAGVAASARGTERVRCTPTRADALGPFYVPGAPVRSRVGSGYVLTGTVKSAANCRPIARARIEFWLANPKGEYDAEHRATVRASRSGRYRFESNRPVPYSGRPPHIHVRVTARGFGTLVTQHYPRAGQSRAVFDLVLRPA